MTDVCPFCEIVRSRSDCVIVTETPDVLVILDRMPLTRGHMLIIPKSHHQEVATLSIAAAAAIGAVLPPLTRALKLVLQADDYNILSNNGERAAQTVPHVHFHLIPRVEGARWNAFGRGPRTEELDEEEGERLASDIRTQLAKLLWLGKLDSIKSKPRHSPEHIRSKL
ncbi:hypothetical protein PYCC9005_001482 [Savitreella phatthalungensis]